MQLHSIDTGALIREFPLGMGALGGISIDKTRTELFFQKVSFLSPGVVYRYNLTDPNAEPVLFYEMKPNSSGFDEKKFEVKQVFYRSRDGTKIPMFIVQKRTTKSKVGPKPLLLYGYSGFGASILPSFDLSRFFFVNSFDGILAVANLRGGGEYGSNWRDDGSLLKKQNSFDDFHAAAEYLIKNRYTTRDQIAINGASNGGLLVGTCINQRPDLYGAAVSRVGVYDMIRSHLFTIGNVTTPTNGYIKDKVHFRNLLQYSPLHNVHKPNSTQNQYPATLIQSCDHDDRVSPLHSYKFTATLQHAVQGNKYQKKPILMRILKDAGHESGKPTYKLIEQESEMLTFLYRALSIKINL